MKRSGFMLIPAALVVATFVSIGISVWGLVLQHQGNIINKTNSPTTNVIITPKDTTINSHNGANQGDTVKIDSQTLQVQNVPKNN